MKASIRAHDDYKNAVRLEQIERLYDQHRSDRRQAKRYRNYQIACAAVYVASLIAETALVVYDHSKYNKMTEEFQKLNEVLLTSRTSFETRDSSVLVKAEWHFD